MYGTHFEQAMHYQVACLWKNDTVQQQEQSSNNQLNATAKETVQRRWRRQRAVAAVVAAWCSGLRWGVEAAASRMPSLTPAFCVVLVHRLHVCYMWHRMQYSRVLPSRIPAGSGFCWIPEQINLALEWFNSDMWSGELEEIRGIWRILKNEASQEPEMKTIPSWEWCNNCDECARANNGNAQRHEKRYHNQWESGKISISCPKFGGRCSSTRDLEVAKTMLPNSIWGVPVRKWAGTLRYLHRGNPRYQTEVVSIWGLSYTY